MEKKIVGWLVSVRLVSGHTKSRKTKVEREILLDFEVVMGGQTKRDRKRTYLEKCSTILVILSATEF